MTIARASLASDPDAVCLGGYEQFCRRMTAIMKAARIEGFLGDRSDDSAISVEENALLGFVDLWAENYGTRKMQTPDLVRLAEQVEGLYLGRAENDRAKTTALGIFLRKHRGATVGNWKIGEPSPTRPTLWHLIPMNGEMTPSTPQEAEQGAFDDRF